MNLNINMFHKDIDIYRRHELKYLCPTQSIELIKHSLSTILDKDRHQGTDGYTIRSLYFDTYTDRLLEENSAGTEIRSKYRIRMYNNDTDYISFEEKNTTANLKDKNSARMSKEAVNKLLANEDWLCECGNDGVLKRIYYLQKTEILRPKLIVEYDRYALTSKVGNVRITFDQCIRASSAIKHFFEKNITMMPILPDNIGLIEVKYDGILPGYIARVINSVELQRVSFSKYALCRNIIDNNGRIEESYELQKRY